MFRKGIHCFNKTYIDIGCVIMKDDKFLTSLSTQACELAIDVNYKKATRSLAINPHLGPHIQDVILAENLLNMGIDTSAVPHGSRFPKSVNTIGKAVKNAHDILATLAIGALPNAASHGADGYLVEDSNVIDIECKVIHLGSENAENKWKKTLLGRIIRVASPDDEDVEMERGEDGKLRISTPDMMKYHKISFELATLANLYTKARDTYMVLVDDDVEGFEIVAIYKMSKETVIRILENSAQGKRLRNGQTNGSQTVTIPMGDFIKESELYCGRYTMPTTGIEAYKERLSANCEETYGYGEPVENASAHLEYLQHLVSDEYKEGVRKMLANPGRGLTKADAVALWLNVFGLEQDDLAKVSIVTSGPLVGVPDESKKYEERHNIELTRAGKSSKCKLPGPTTPKTIGHDEMENGLYRPALLIGYVGAPGFEKFGAYLIPYEKYNTHGLHSRIYICNDTWEIDDKNVFSDCKLELPISSLQEARELAAPVATKFTVSQNGMGIHREV